MFLNEQKIFLVQAFGRHASPTKIRQEFLKYYAIKKGRPTSMYRLNQFVKVCQHFLQSRSITPTRTKRGKTKRTDAGIQEVRSHVSENRVALNIFGKQRLIFHQASPWKILRYYLKFKFYRITSVQPLKDAHKQQRRQFCEWLLSQSEDIVQKIIWRDEKFFCLQQKPHRKNDDSGRKAILNKITEASETLPACRWGHF